MILGSSDSIGKSRRQKILAQAKVSKTGEYCMYFLFLELHGWGKRFAVRPQTIYSEFPLKPAAADAAAGFPAESESSEVYRFPPCNSNI